MILAIMKKIKQFVLTEVKFSPVNTIKWSEVCYRLNFKNSKNYFSLGLDVTPAAPYFSPKIYPEFEGSMMFE